MSTEALRAALEEALDCLESLQGGCTDSDDGTVEAITIWCPEVIETIRAALAQPSAERDALRAENERLRKACATGWGEPVLVNTLRAEVEALRADADRWRNIRDYIDALVKERDYLRAELDRIYART